MLFWLISPLVVGTEWLAQDGLPSLSSLLISKIPANQQPKYQPLAIDQWQSSDHKGHVCVQKRLFVLWNILQIAWVKAKKLMQKGRSVWGQNMFPPPFEVSEEQTELGRFFPTHRHSVFGRPRSVTILVIWEHLSIKYLRCSQPLSYSQDENFRENYWEVAWWILNTHKWQWRHLEPHRVIFQHRSYLDQAILTSHLQVEDDHILFPNWVFLHITIRTLSPAI